MDLKNAFARDFFASSAMGGFRGWKAQMDRACYGRFGAVFLALLPILVLATLLRFSSDNCVSLCASAFDAVLLPFTLCSCVSHSCVLRQG